MKNAGTTEKLTEKVQRVIARRAGAIQQPSLPTRVEVGLVTLTVDELSDLTYEAARRATERLRLPPDRGRRLSGIAADQAVSLALAHDGFHRGTDPRE